jgi:uncharacterized protein (TIGR02246 family)
MKRLRLVGILAALLWCGACAQTAEPQKPAPAGPTPADTAALEKLRNDFVAAYNSADVARLTGLFTADAVLLLPNQPPVEGQQAIQGYFQGFFSQFNATFAITSQEVRYGGEWAFDRGGYQVKLTPKTGGKEIEDSGKYLVILERQQDGSWKIARDIDNSNGPPPAPAEKL